MKGLSHFDTQDIVVTWMQAYAIHALSATLLVTRDTHCLHSSSQYNWIALLSTYYTCKQERPGTDSILHIDVVLFR